MHTQGQSKRISSRRTGAHGAAAVGVLCLVWLAPPVAAQTTTPTTDPAAQTTTTTMPDPTTTTAVLPDPLHGYCATGCFDNGINSPSTSNPPVDFGFTVNPGPQTGDFVIDVLVPNDENTPAAGPFTINGTSSGAATQVSTTAFASDAFGLGNNPTLSQYLNAVNAVTPLPDTAGSPPFPSQPDTNLMNYLQATQGVDPTATGFFVYQADLGSTMLQDPSTPNVSPLLTISPGLPLGSFITAFLNEGTAGSPSWVSTSNSGAIFLPTPRIVEPSALILLGTALAALGGFGWYRRKSVVRPRPRMRG